MSNPKPKSFLNLTGDAFKGAVGVAYKGTKLGLIGIGYGLGVGKQILDDIVQGIDEGQKLSSLSKDEEKDATVTQNSSVPTAEDIRDMARQEIQTQFANWKQKPGNEHKEFADFQAECHELFHPEEMKA